MKIVVLIVMSLMFLNLLQAQNNAIRITNIETSEEKILTDGQRIRVTTVAGKKHSGKLQILEDNSIIVHNTKLALAEIAKMKAHPLGMTLVTSALFIYTGLVATGLSLLVVIYGGEPLGYLGLIPSAAILYGGFTGVNILQGYHIVDGYSYELVKI